MECCTLWTCLHASCVYALVSIEIFSGRFGNYPTNYRITPFEVHGSRYAFMDDG
jgi:hypothetical protein